MSEQTHRMFKEIVLEGVLADRGMSSFADRLSEKDVEDIYTFIIARSWQDYQAQEAAKEKKAARKPACYSSTECTHTLKMEGRLCEKRVALVYCGPKARLKCRGKFSNSGELIYDALVLLNRLRRQVRAFSSRNSIFRLFLRPPHRGGFFGRRAVAAYRPHRALPPYS